MSLKINPQQQTKKITSFIKKTLAKQGFKKVIIALSGGIDSSTCLFLLNKALNKKNIFVVLLPDEKQKMADAQQVIDINKVPLNNIIKINIQPIVKATNQSIVKAKIKRPRSLRRGNISARMRMTLLYDLAKVKNCLVCGTENKSESILGYFTLWGDQAADFNLINHLYKTQVIQLAKYLKVPEKIINKPASAGLWPGQTDEKELGFSYQQADPILYLKLNKKLTIPQIINQGYRKELVLKVLNRVKEKSFKQQVPYQL